MLKIDFNFSFQQNSLKKSEKKNDLAIVYSKKNQ